MHEINGIVYGDDPREPVKVTRVKPLKGKMMIVSFSTGETRLFDATILQGEAFKCLDDENIFMNPAIVGGAVTWDDERVDVAPEYMLAKSYEYNTEDILTA